jgi:hypothetical protein
MGMVLYTVMPPEEILADLEAERQVITILREGLLMEVEPMAGARGSLVRMLSSNPQDFLDPRWQPGSVIDLVAADYPTEHPAD